MKFSLNLSSNALKIIAVISMTLDHIGLMFFPQYSIFRIIGRMAFPIFAFMIAEGTKYTKNKLKYFLLVLSVGVICQVAYTLYSRDIYFNILIAFSISILLIYVLQILKGMIFDSNKPIAVKIFFFCYFILTVFVVYIFNLLFDVDYGFFGCLLPVFASFFHLPKNISTCERVKRFDSIKLSILMLSLGMLFLTLDLGIDQAWSFSVIPLLFLYSGSRGRLKMKYFFYFYYPAHLLILEAVSMII